MSEVLSLAKSLIPHWEQHLADCEAGADLARKNLAYLALHSSGQLELEYPIDDNIELGYN